jgi:thioredoxin reductase (NADPH)
MEQMRLQAAHVGTVMVNDHIVNADLGRHPFVLTGDSERVYTCDTLVIATGAKAKWLGIPSEETFKGYGVSACATCDGFFYRGKDVVVVGGGNSAVEEALYLSQMASRVTVVHRRDGFKAERILQQRLFGQPNVDIIWNHAVDEILGTLTPLGVTHVRLKNTVTGTLRDVETHGVFVAIGHHPATELFHGQVKLKPNGYIETAANSTATNIPGVFAAGDVADDIWRQAVTAAGMGCMAALEADRWLAARSLAAVG